MHFHCYLRVVMQPLLNWWQTCKVHSLYVLLMIVFIFNVAMSSWLCTLSWHVGSVMKFFSLRIAVEMMIVRIHWESLWLFWWENDFSDHCSLLLYNTCQVFIYFIVQGVSILHPFYVCDIKPTFKILVDDLEVVFKNVYVKIDCSVVYIILINLYFGVLMMSQYR